MITFIKPYFNYLRTKITVSGLTILLLFFALFNMLNSSLWPYFFVGLLVLGFCFLFRAPRWICYLILFLGFAFYTHNYIYTISTPQDPASDRDEAVIIGAKALLNKENPWGAMTQYNNPITTGPASILLAIPNILATDNIDFMTWIFWLLFIFVILAGDLINKNNSFLELGLLFIFISLGFDYTLGLSVSELYFPFALIFFSWILLKNNYSFMAGLLMGLAILCRLNYIFLIFGLISWFYFSDNFSYKALLKILLGITVISGIIFIIYWLVVGKNLLIFNPLIINYNVEIHRPGWPTNNYILNLLNKFISLGSTWRYVIKTLISLPLIVFLAYKVKSFRFDHPFWHLAATGLITHTVIFNAQFPMDYILMFIIPAFWAIAYSKPMISKQT